MNTGKQHDTEELKEMMIDYMDDNLTDEHGIEGFTDLFGLILEIKGIHDKKEWDVYYICCEDDDMMEYLNIKISAYIKKYGDEGFNSLIEIMKGYYYEHDLFYSTFNPEDYEEARRRLFLTKISKEYIDPINLKDFDDSVKEIIDLWK